jgi:hypothetical protein
VLSLNPALQFTLFDYALQVCKRRLHTDQLSTLQTFLLGMLTKMITMTLVYPLVRAKTLLQASEEGGGMLQVLARVRREEGILGWYRGLDAQLGKSMMSTALLLTAKDRIAMAMRKVLIK